MSGRRRGAHVDPRIQAEREQKAGDQVVRAADAAERYKKLVTKFGRKDAGFTQEIVLARLADVMAGLTSDDPDARNDAISALAWLMKKIEEGKRVEAASANALLAALAESGKTL